MKRYLAGRRVVDVQGPSGSAMSAIGTDRAIFQEYSEIGIGGIRAGKAIP